MGAGSGDAGGVDIDHEYIAASSSWVLKPFQPFYHNGGFNMGKTSPNAALTQTEIALLVSAAQTSQAAFETAIAATGAAGWYSGLVADAVSKSVPSAQAPPQALWRFFKFGVVQSWPA